MNLKLSLKIICYCFGFLFFANGNVLAAACPTTNIFTTSGTCTYTVPAGVSSIEVFVMGGGGGGGGGCKGVSSTSTCCSGGGGNGGSSAKMGHQLITVTPGQQYEITVGAGGVGGGGVTIYSQANGSNGASSNFGSAIISAGGTGGSGGWIIPEHNGSAGGAGNNSSVVGINASAGGAGSSYYTSNGGAGGSGGSGYGSGGGGGGGGNFGGISSNGMGGGGAGGTGANGYIRIENGSPCGSAASRTALAPTTNLCAPGRGTASAVSGTGTGPFTWTCSSLGGINDSTSFINNVNAAQYSGSYCNSTKQVLNNSLPGSLLFSMNHWGSSGGVCMCNTSYSQYQNNPWSLLRIPVGYKITGCTYNSYDSSNWPIWRVTMENETAVSCETTINQNPVVNAGANMTVSGGATISFNDAVVTDPEGDPLSYLWYCGGVGTLSSPTSLQTNFIAPTVSSNTIVACELFAYDDKGGIMFGVKNITVTPVGSVVNGSCSYWVEATYTAYPGGGCDSGTPSAVTRPYFNFPTHTGDNFYGSWYWTCNGINGGTSASCCTNPSGSRTCLCGSALNVPTTVAPTSNTLCSNGGVQNKSGSYASDPDLWEGSWYWVCAGSQGNYYCSAPGSVPGACGTTQIGSAHRILNSSSVSLCGSGTVTGFTGNIYGPWSWTCNATGGNSGTCDAAFSNVAPTISAITETSTIPEGGTLGLNATATDADGDTSLSYSWTCTGGSLVNGNTATPTYTAPIVTADTTHTCTVTTSDIFGANASRSTNLNIDDNLIVGACGTANGQRFVTLQSSSTSLCAPGNTVASFNGTGPWNWDCVGAETVHCSASKTLPNWTEQ